MFEKKRVWYISCSTGCTCCADRNFDQGFYDNPEVPQGIIDEWRQGNGNPLSSQFAKYGHYHLRETEAEVLPDGRWIVDNIVFDADEVENFPGRMYW